VLFVPIKNNPQYNNHHKRYTKVTNSTQRWRKHREPAGSFVRAPLRDHGSKVGHPATGKHRVFGCV